MVAVVESNANSNIVGQLNSGFNESNILNGNGTISRTNSGCGYVSSTSSAMTDEPCVSCTTFNILAPIYKRLDQKNQSVRESNFRAVWLSRNQKILNWLLHERSSIICLQEFWVGNEELVHMYQQSLGDAGYVTFQLARTNNRGDGLLTAVRKDCFTVLNCREVLFHDCGDRVAQLLHVQSALPFSQNRKGTAQQEFLIVNTHLLFPHDSCLSVVRLDQVYKILQYVEQYQRENKLNLMPILLCGDWNGSKSGHVYKFLRSQGFVSSYDIAHQYTDSYADAHRWVSHRNHRGNICGVDFIWLCNSIKSRKPLKKSWSEAVFGIIKCQLQKASLVEKDAFAFLKADNHGNFITYSAFCEALRQVNLIGLPYGLSSQETEDLWMQADINGNGVVGYEEFKRRIWNSECSEPREENCSERTGDCEQGLEEEAIGFNVKKAVLFPREAEKGRWPENYSLSDHAPLTVVFSPVRIQGSQRVTRL
ncbi:hypothetical protein POPTR_002G182500v4 [Populus trichocarpa]|uniref:Endonuclease/exonuclease/phosphatase domain-containing protein n=1 Tax=Populus trichocarpa TaxID=3694 RepID=B9GRT1_POPTR|nr:uncharacterized calcium-binding protein At1g02270 [Populus trichocarpa]PNT50355.1 hypothetical protein POPTR_002G182500v4 [Populus trichocarpa]|eukprot:XP_002302684.2 uncharacterized calcium-binding protein At1g02270 [Populus trichocarpa]